MIETALRSHVEGVRQLAATLDPACIAPRDAQRLLSLFATLEHVAAAAKTALVRRVDDAGLWRHDGYRSPAQWLAAATGDTVSSAQATIDTARHLEALPTTAQRFRAGELSAVQARTIAAAAAVDPDAEEGLLRRAEVDSVTGLREEARRVIAAAEVDESARYRRIYDTRNLRTWTDADGAGCGMWRLPPDRHAEILAVIAARREEIFRTARRQGRREAPEAYDADALVDIILAGAAGGAGGDSGGCGKPINVSMHVMIDFDALRRGYTEPGERCEIAGVGPIPVATARAYLGEAFLQLLVTNGFDITTIAHCGRHVPTKLRTYLQARDRTCVVPGCDWRHRLEVDHTFTNFADGGPLSPDNTALLCPWHHYLKTHCGYRLTGRPSHWEWISPHTNTNTDSDPTPPRTVDRDSGPPTGKLEELCLAIDDLLTTRRQQ